MNALDILRVRNFSLWNFGKVITSEEQAIAAAHSWLLIPTSAPRCRNIGCGGRPMRKDIRRSYKIGFRWRCGRRDCRKIISPLKNTFFDRSHISVLATLRLILHFLRRDKVSQAAIDVGVTKKAAIQIYHFLREVCEIAEAHDRMQIGGDNDVVEMDETHLYTRKYHRGRILRSQLWAFGCISRLTKKLHIEVIPNKTRAILDPIIAANVRPNSYLMSDMHRAYVGVHLRLNMRGHSSVNHSVEYVNGTVDIPVNVALGVQVPNTQNVSVKVHTNTIERQWLELKRHCRTCRSDSKIKWYMGEYMYRQNILKLLPSDAARFRRLLRDIHRVYPGPKKRGIKLTNCRCSPDCPRRGQNN